VLELLVLAATITLAGWASGAAVHRRALARRALAEYARSRALHFVPPPDGARGASPAVLGTQDGVDYRIELYRLGADIRTRVCAAVPHAGGPELSLSKRGAFTWTAPPAFELDDATFDAAYVVMRGEPALADDLRAIVGPLQALWRREGVWLRSDGARVNLCWRGVEENPLVLDTARETVAAVAGWRRAPRPYR
jgi:hypothetical protein